MGQVAKAELEFLNNLWGLYEEPRRNRVIVPARQATWARAIHSLESIPGLHKRFKNTGSGLHIKGQLTQTLGYIQ
jgi:hypothetical protein